MPAITMVEERIDRDLLRQMEVLLVGAAAALLDLAIANFALDDLTGAFHTTVSTAQRATAVYPHAMAAAIPLMCWLTDRSRARRVWLGTLGAGLGGIGWPSPPRATAMSSRR